MHKKTTHYAIRTSSKDHISQSSEDQLNNHSIIIYDIQDVHLLRTYLQKIKQQEKTTNKSLQILQLQQKIF